MRVTQSILNRNALYAIDRNFERVGKLNEQLSSGKRVNTVSDDLPATRDIMRFERDNSQLEIFQENTEKVNSTLNFATSNLEEASETLARAKELAVQGATDTYGPSEREAMAEGADALLNSLISLANTEYQGRHLFAGQATDTLPFETEIDAEGNIQEVEYQGASDTTKVRIGPGVESELSFNGRPIFQGDTDIFQTLIDLRNAFDENDTDGINDAIGEIESGHRNIRRHLGNLGERTAQLDVMQNSVESMLAMNKELQSERQDADIAELSTEYMNMMTLMQTVMKVASNTSQLPSLAHYM